MDVLLGILAALVGAAICLAGLRVFFAILPIAGFVVGFFTGAAFSHWLFNSPFLEATGSIVFGLILGVVFAALSYLYWYIGVLLAAGGTGAVLGAGLFAAFGVSSAWLLWTIGFITAALFVALAIVIAYPVYLVIFATALQGAVLVLGGILLMFGSIERGDVVTAAAWERINDNWFLWIVWVVIAAIGIGAQLQTVRQIVLPEDKWTKAEPPATAPATTA